MGQSGAAWTEAFLNRVHQSMDEVDRLAREGADLHTLVTVAASTADVTWGVRTVHGEVVCADPGGLRSPAGPAPASAERTLPDGTHVWLTSGDVSPLVSDMPPTAGLRSGAETLALRCFGDIIERVVTDTSARRLAADIHAIVDPQSAAEERRGSLRRLGLDDRAPVTLLALAGAPAQVEEVIEQIRRLAALVHHVRQGALHLVIAQQFTEADTLNIPQGVRGGHSPPGPPADAPDAWRQARNALRFAMPSTHDAGPYATGEAVLIDSAQLGCYAILAEQLTQEALANVPVVQRLTQLLQESGPGTAEILLAVAATDSLRQAARKVHLHHNSVAHRVQRAEKALGFACTEGYGRARLLLTLTLHRLLESHKIF